MYPIFRQRRKASSTALSWATSTSSMKTLPEVGLSSPPTMLKKVLLPEPEGPITARNSPRRISTVMPRRAQVVTLPIW